MQSFQTLTSADLDRVAVIHQVAFPNSVLTRLGHKTVRRYYEWLLLGPHDAVALGQWSEGELAGFSFAGVFRGALSGFLHRNWMFLFWRVLAHPRILARRNYQRNLIAGIRAMIPPFRCEAKNAPLWPAGEVFGILVLAIDPAYGRLGYGRLLMNACAQIAADRKFSIMCLTVQTANEPAIRFYESLGWLKVATDGRWYGVMYKPVSPSPVSQMSDACGEAAPQSLP